MPYMKRPRTADAYVDMVNQAIVEVEEMQASLEYDVEEEGQRFTFLPALHEALQDLKKTMADGSYVFENKDLPFMPLVNRFRTRLPFAELLATINRTHREGLDVEGED